MSGKEFGLTIALSKLQVFTILYWKTFIKKFLLKMPKKKEKLKRIFPIPLHFWQKVDRVWWARLRSVVWTLHYPNFSILRCYEKPSSKSLFSKCRKKKVEKDLSDSAALLTKSRQGLMSPVGVRSLNICIVQTSIF